MKFKLSFKTPDVIDQMDDHLPIDDSVMEVIRKFVKYGENISVEFDTETGTATVEKVC